MNHVKMHDSKAVKNTVFHAFYISPGRRQTSTSNQIDIEDLPALIDSDDDEMLIDKPLPFSPTP